VLEGDGAAGARRLHHGLESRIHGESLPRYAVAAPRPVGSAIHRQEEYS